MMLVKTAVRPSQMHGLGCFTLEPIVKGQTVWGLVLGMDVKFSETQVESMQSEWADFVRHHAYLSGKSGGWVLPLDDARYMNHSATPNLVSDHGGRDVATRDIDAGEELTCDYRTFDADWFRKLDEGGSKPSASLGSRDLGQALEDVGHKHGVFDMFDEEDARGPF